MKVWKATATLKDNERHENTETVKVQIHQWIILCFIIQCVVLHQHNIPSPIIIYYIMSHQGRNGFAESSEFLSTLMSNLLIWYQIE